MINQKKRKEYVILCAKLVFPMPSVNRFMNIDLRPNQIRIVNRYSLSGGIIILIPDGCKKRNLKKNKMKINKTKRKALENGYKNKLSPIFNIHKNFWNYQWNKLY